LKLKIEPDKTDELVFCRTS